MVTRHVLATTQPQLEAWKAHPLDGVDLLAPARFDCVSPARQLELWGTHRPRRCSIPLPIPGIATGSILGRTFNTVDNDELKRPEGGL
jgi:hypothetical protein